MRNFILCLMLGVGCVCAVDAHAEESNFGNSKGYNWQDREYFGSAYTERQLGGGDSAGDAGDGGAGAGSGAGAGAGDGAASGCN